MSDLKKSLQKGLRVQLFIRIASAVRIAEQLPNYRFADLGKID